MPILKFIHTADLHLGSIVHSNGQLPEKIYQKLINAANQAFKNICDFAIAEKVNFLLLSGDIYDHKSPSVLASMFFNQQCSRLKQEGINVYMIGGNHDPQQKRQELSEVADNIFLFGSEQVGREDVYDANGNLIARILGQSYRGPAESRKTYTAFSVPDKSVFNIGLLHTQLDPQNNNYLPCSLKDLLAQDGINYWALGHIHQTRLLYHAKSRAVAYPGTPQGRDVGEEGPGGALLVEVAANMAVKISYIPTSTIIWKNIELELEQIQSKGPANLTDLKNILISKGETILSSRPEIPENFTWQGKGFTEIIQGYMIRWNLKGRGKINQVFEEQGEEAVIYLKEELQNYFNNRSPFIWTDSIFVRTANPLPTLLELKEKSQLFTEIEQFITLCTADQTVKSQLIDQMGRVWTGNIDHESYSETRFQVDDFYLREIIKQAEQLIIEAVLSRRELL